MKKIICLVCTLMMLSALCSCQPTNRTTDEGNSSVTPSESSEKQILNAHPTIGLSYCCWLKGFNTEVEGYTFNIVGNFPPYCEVGEYPDTFHSYKCKTNRTLPSKSFSANMRGSYHYVYDYSTKYRGLGMTNTFKLMSYGDFEKYSFGGSDAIYYYNSVKSEIEVWDRDGLLRSMKLSTREFPEVKISGSITEKALADKAQELLNLYDSSIKVSEFSNNPQVESQISENRYAENQYKEGVVAGAVCYRVTWSHIGEDGLTSYICFEYDSENGVADICIERNAAVRFENKAITDKVISDTWKVFIEEYSKNQPSGIVWRNPELYSIGHEGGYTIIVIAVYFDEENPGEFPHERRLFLNYEIPDGTDILKGISSI